MNTNESTSRLSSIASSVFLRMVSAISGVDGREVFRVLGRDKNQSIPRSDALGRSVSSATD